MSDKFKLMLATAADSGLWLGILNLTPDSFSDGGDLNDFKHFTARCEALLRTGCHALDVGAVSTRPGAADVSHQEELQRLREPLQWLRKAYPNVPISLDTSSPQTALWAAENGLIDLINDVWAGRLKEPFSTISVAAKFNLPMILMHMQKTPANMQNNPIYNDCIAEVCDFLQERQNTALKEGVPWVSIDPGIGFGKTLEHNLQLLSSQGISALLRINNNVTVGLSRKRFLAQLSHIAQNQTEKDITNPKERDVVSKYWEQKSILLGVKIIRTHVGPGALHRD